MRSRNLLLGTALAASLPGLATANAPTGRYFVLNGTVLDMKTNLTWQQAASTTKYYGVDRDSACTSLGQGWRMPTIRELVTLVDFSRQGSPKIDPVFAGTQSGYYWSSTWIPSPLSALVTLNFDTGVTGWDDLVPSHYVRCVR